MGEIEKRRHAFQSVILEDFRGEQLLLPLNGFYKDHIRSRDEGKVFLHSL